MFVLGIKEMLPVSPGIAAWGVTTGVALANSGMSMFEVSAMTLMVFAGSSQLAAMPLIVAGAPLWVIWLTALCVNLRFAVFSAHVRPFFMKFGLPKRITYAYLLTDLSYVIFIKRYKTVPTTDHGIAEMDRYWSALGFINWFTWMLFSFLGIALASVIPLSWGLSFAGILALMGISCSLVTTRLRAFAAVLSGTAAVAAFALPLKLNILVGVAAAVAISLLIDRSRSSHE
jgi:predicted branched-subunit amino acid permease